MKRIDTKRFIMKHPPDAVVTVGYLATRRGYPAVRLPDNVLQRVDRKGRPEWVVMRRWRLCKSWAEADRIGGAA